MCAFLAACSALPLALAPVHAFGENARIAQALSPATPFQQSLLAVARVEERIATIGHRLAVANRDVCRVREWRLGLATHAMSQYAARFRRDVAAVFGFNSGVSVLAVAEGGPAARAELRMGDEILAVDAAPVAGAAAAGGASFREAEAFLDQIEAAAADGAVTLAIRRGGARHRLTIRGEEGCASRFQLKLSDELNAAADGRYVQITSRSAEFAQNDDELAAIAAHELAHNILEHRARLNAAGINRGLLQNFGRSARLTRETEIEADRLSIRLMHKAGYDPHAAIAYTRRALRNRLFTGGTHPPRRERVAAMEEEIARLPPA
jgi:uncharacterized small protein (DUF1192 family)